jgi:NAD(P)-dependent dehydrogenase (short-subunit alcohol dehydrogenase family)
MKPLAIIAGAGPGLGQALLARFEAGGFMPVGLGRTQPNNFTGEFHEIDLSEENDVDDTISAVIRDYGAPQVVIHNVAELIINPFEDAHISDYQKTWSSMVRSAVLVARATLKPMVRAGGGSFLVSGATASLRGGANFSAFASAKFALRGLTQSLAREFQPSGVHVCHFILDGIIDTQRSRDMHSLDPSKMMDPADVAEAYWQIAHQPQSTWTHELDLRPATEKF